MPRVGVRRKCAGGGHVGEVCGEELLYPIFPRDTVFIVSLAIHSFYVKTGIIVVFVIRQEHMNIFFL